MEFYSDGKGWIIFAGYSLFRTNAGGAYEGNRLLPDAEIERRLSAYVPVAALHRLREELQRRLVRLFGDGVYRLSGSRYDDLPVRSLSGVSHPSLCGDQPADEYGTCVPDAIRSLCTARGWRTFRISYHPSDGQALQEHDAMTVAHPLDTRNGRVVKGYLPLVPVRKSSRYRAYILVETGG